MTTPEPRSVELEPLVLSFDEDLVENEQDRISETDIRELSAYTFDSNDETLVGIGGSGSADSGLVRHFDSSDRTLVGIGPLDGDKQVDDLEFVDYIEVGAPEGHALPAERTPESVPMPLSESPGPFVSADADEPRLSVPMKKSEPWLFALPAVLAAAAGVTALRAVMPSTNAAHTHAAAIAPPLVTEAALTSNTQFETAAAISAEPRTIDVSSTPLLSDGELALPSAPTVPHEKHASSPQSAGSKSLAKEALGALDATSNPPSSLVLDGRPLGKTPRVLQLASGPHTVVFVHPERGRMSVTVNVRAGRTTSASANF